MSNADTEAACNECSDMGYILIGCCSGHMCGCRGLPVDCEHCLSCNPDGDKEPSDQAKKDWPWFFASEEEQALLKQLEGGSNE